jgi:hypothetical protein
MKRWVQGFYIVLGSLAATALVLAAALAWGPHHCKAAFPMVIGCALGSYETLAGGMIAAGAALFAGWLAWSAVQVQIEAEAKRAATDKVEVEAVLQDDLDYFAEGLGAIWKILEGFDAAADPLANRTKLEGVIYGIEKITKADWLSTSRKMVTQLGWQRRRRYEEFFEGLERLGRFRLVDDFYDVERALSAVRSVANDLVLLRPGTGQYFEGRFWRGGKAWTLGYAIEVHAGVNDQ